jgi:glutamyl-tRNA synthetase
MDAAFVFSKTRLAPTPSGFLHLGNVLSFAVTAALAGQTGASLLLRIDDLDRERISPAYVQDIFDTLHFLEIPWEEGPRSVAEYEQTYSQLHRLPLYRQALQQLAAQGLVFACTCSRTEILRVSANGVYPGTCRDKQLPLDTPGACWRLRTVPETLLQVQEWNGAVHEAMLPATMYDFVVKKKDGFPAYQLASLIDDLHWGVDLVVRGEDLRASTLAQLYLASMLGFNRFLSVRFLHHPLLMEKGGTKLSKSAGATSVQYLRKQGWQPPAVFAAIGDMLGIAPPVRSWEELGRGVVNS